MFNPLLFIEHPDRLLFSQRKYGMLTGRVVPFGDLHFWKEILVFKGFTLYSLYKEGGQAGGQRSGGGGGL